MNNAIILDIYIPCALISTVILVIELSRRLKRKEDYLLLILCFCAVGWYASNITSLISSNEEVIKFFLTFGLIFVGFIPPILLLFTLRFYKVPYWPSRTALAAMFVIPSINVVMVLTSRLHTLVNAKLEVVALAPLRDIALEWGKWFWVHTVYSYIVSMTLIGVILYQHFRLPRFYRLPSTMMVTGVSLTLAGNMVTLLGGLPQAMDPTLIAMSLSLIMFNLAVVNNNKSVFVRFSQGKLYHYLKLYILVLDENGRVADFNKPAFEWFSHHGIALNNSYMGDIEVELIGRGTKKSLENDEGVDYYIDDNDFPVVLNLCVHELNDAKGDPLGSLAVFTDVTQNRMLIKRLEEKAGMDSLTGLANHMAYDGAKKRLDKSERLPLSIIMCDANGLKTVNDNMGHKYGDALLQAIASVLEKVCPKNCFVARIGGDEFVYLLPNTDEESSYALAERIKAALAEYDSLPFTLSVALGAATKLSADENLSDIIELADSRMYDDKMRAKARLAAGQA